MSDTGQEKEREAVDEKADKAAGHDGESELVELLNKGYVCPPWAGPAWREAHVAGVDMGLIEDALGLAPAERLRQHQRALNLILDVIRARDLDAPGS